MHILRLHLQFALPAALLVYSNPFPSGQAATIVPASAALNHVSLENSGFRIRTDQADSPAALTNTISRAEQQLAGTLIDPSTGNPFANVADLSAASADGSFIVPGVVNYSTSRGGFAGNFIPDDQMPGIPGNTTDPSQSVENVAMEITAYLEFKAGNYRFGVNAADGFAASVRDISGNPLILGQSEESGETQFDFSITKDGFYPFRFVYVHGAGEGSIELFSVDSQSEDKILLNDSTDDRSIKTYYPSSAASVVSLQPEAGADSVAATAPISAVIFHTFENLDTNTIRLTLDGALVTPTLTAENDTNYLKIAYQPPNALIDGNHQASLVFGASNTELVTNQWSFKVGLPSEIRLTIVPNGKDVTVNWTGGGTLQTSQAVNGPWADVPASSGTITITPTAPTAFYRVRRP